MPDSCLVTTLALSIDPESIRRVFGRLHPVLVHFPIALIIVAGMVELWRLIVRRDRPSPTALTCCGIGVMIGLLAAASGWINADAETHSARFAQTMEWHRWLGIGACVLGVAAWTCGMLARNPSREYVRRWWCFLLFTAAGTVGFTGHLGGNMVWGEGYIYAPLSRAFEPIDAEPGQPAPDRRRLAPAGTTLIINYETQVRPILFARCVECHGESSAKGGLRLDELYRAFVGDEALWSISPGKPDDSEFMYRVKLGTESEDRMPPEGSPLTPGEIGILQRWIAEGAFEGVADE